MEWIELLTKVNELDGTAKRVCGDVPGLIVRGVGRFDTVHKQKEVKVMDVAVSINYMDGGRGQMFAFLKDMTKRKQVEAERAMLAAILEATKAVVIMAAPQGMLLYVNRSGRDLLGIGKEEDISNRLMGEFVHKGDRLKLSEEIIPTTINDGTWDGEIILLSKDSREIPVSVVFLAHETSEGSIEFISMIAHDITGRKRMEEGLRRIPEQYRSLVETSPDPTSLTELNGDIVLANRPSAELCGYDSAHELIGTSVFDLVTPEDRQRVMQAARKVAKSMGAKVTAAECMMCRKNSTVFPSEMSTSSIVDAEGNPRYLLVTTRDITGRKRREEQIQRQLQHLAALRDIDLSITSSLDLKITLNVLLDQVITQLGVDAADVLLFNRHTSRLEFATGQGFRTCALRYTRLRLGEGHAGRAALERCTKNIPNLAEDPGDLARAPLLSEESFIAYYAVPLVAKSEIKGVLEVFHRSRLDPDQEWLDFLEMLARQAAIALDNAMLFEEVQNYNLELATAYDATLEGWVRALDLRDKETEDHTQRVTEMALRLAEAFGLSERELINVRRGSLLHDIGKIGIPDSILFKPGVLSEEEMAIMRLHPVYAYDFLSPIAFLRPAIDIPYCHHERWDGYGYPRRLRGQEIPLMPRIFAVVDVWDALRCDRTYRSGWPEQSVSKYIAEQSGKHFDPQVVEEFLKLLVSPIHVRAPLV